MHSIRSSLQRSAARRIAVHYALVVSTLIFLGCHLVVTCVCAAQAELFKMQLAAAEQHRSRVGMSISAMHQGEDLLTAEQVAATQAARAHNLRAHEEAVQLQAQHRWEAICKDASMQTV